MIWDVFLNMFSIVFQKVMEILRGGVQLQFWGYCDVF